MEKINESIIATITAPILSGKALVVFSKELKRWKEVGFITKFEKNRFLSKIKLTVKGIDKPYIINITGILKKYKEEGSNKSEKLKSRLVGKIKSPFRWFQSFKQAGFSEIMEKLFETIESDVDDNKVKKLLNLNDEEYDAWKNEFDKTLSKTKRKAQVFKQIDSGNLQMNLGLNANDLGMNENTLFSLKEEIKKKSGI